MAPKRLRRAGSSSDPYRFLDANKKEHYKLIKTKGVVQERSIDFPNITFLPRMQEIAEGYEWMNLNNMIDNCNISWVEEFYANALGRPDDDYTSYVHGVEINYAPDVIDTIFGFRQEEHCWVRQRRETARTDAEYTEMLQTLALPGRDWRYTNHGVRSHLQITDTMPVAKGWAKWLVHNFESCSN
ncbi:hypothetical protein A2U01_0037977, partial [Trifolium medium]|nr:hypothetical protein [Trifolium medium]